MKPYQKDLLISCEYHMINQEDLKSKLKQHGRQILQDLMQYSGLSLRKFAAKLGIHPSYLCKVLKGDNIVTIEVGARMEAYFANET